MSLPCKLFGHVYEFTGHAVRVPIDDEGNEGSIERLQCCKCGSYGITTRNPDETGQYTITDNIEVIQAMNKFIEHDRCYVHKELEHLFISDLGRRIYNVVMRILLPFTKPKHGIF